MNGPASSATSGGKAHVNPDVGFALAEGDELVVIALDEPQL